MRDQRLKKIEKKVAEEFEAKKKVAAALAVAPYCIQRAIELNEIDKVKSVKAKDPPYPIPDDVLRQWNLIADVYMEMTPTPEVPIETAATKSAKDKDRAGSSRDEGTGAGKKSKSKKRRQLDEPVEESGRKKKKSKSK